MNNTRQEPLVEKCLLILSVYRNKEDKSPKEIIYCYTPTHFFTTLKCLKNFSSFERIEVSTLREKVNEA